MKLKTVGSEGSIIFLTEEMLESLTNHKIHLYSLVRSMLEGDVYLDPHPEEVAEIMLLQTAVATNFGVKGLEECFKLLHTHNNNMSQLTTEEKLYAQSVRKSFNDYRGGDKLKSLCYRLGEHSVSPKRKYHVKYFKDNTLVIVMGSSDKVSDVSFNALTHNKLPEALLEAIYMHLGYMDSHFGTLPKADSTSGELCLSELLRYIKT